MNVYMGKVYFFNDERGYVFGFLMRVDEIYRLEG